MNDPKRTLSKDEVDDAGLDDWWRLGATLQARFDTGDFATGLAFVNQVGSFAEDANHHPDIVLTYPQVTVTLISHDVGGITSRDVDLARRISAAAAESGIAAETSPGTD